MINIPKVTPNIVPKIPIITPCNIYIFNITICDIPFALSMAMSRCLSFTTIISVDTMLNAATAITESKMINNIDLVICMERKKFE